ncbi:MAG: c-type cytochrome [Planctomycetes bacterium]|nr:c-type cytochrome [Planctomycetota bacterium]
MRDILHYPMSEFGPAIHGMVIGGVGILHVFVAQFAVGAGGLLLWLERRAGRGDELSRRFLDGYFLFLVLVSFVFGALTGVGMWLTAIQVSAPTIGTMVDEFHWLWAAEWCCFLLEVVSGYLFFRYRTRLGHRTRTTLLAMYAVSSWLSLFLIDGILSWQLTPGEWLATHSVVDGFFNPSFWPSLVYRTLVAWTLAALVAVLVSHLVGGFTAEERRGLQRRIAPFFAPMAVMPLVGLWFVAVLPADSRGWLFGGSVAMTMFLAIAVGASTLLGLYAVVGVLWRRLTLDRATVILLLVLAFVATGAGEFVREGSRKPYTVREVLYSNAILPGAVLRLREVGCVTDDPYPLRGELPPTAQLGTGAKVFRAQCRVCHSIDGANGVLHLTGSWMPDQIRMNIAKLQHTKPFMPPFAGTPAELEALTQWLLWLRAGRPDRWEPATPAEVERRIAAWLEEAGPYAAEHARKGGR